MINLLPPDKKANFRYARKNVGLRRWATSLLLILVGLAGLATYGLLNFQQSTNSYEKQVAAAQADLAKSELPQTEAKVKDITGSLRLAAQVLSKEVLFSKLITQIGHAMPKDAVLSGLNINQTTGGIDLNANAKDYVTASQVQVNLANPDNKIFAKADIVSISCNAPTQAKASYPCSVTIRALFTGNNPFLFINQGGKK
jgi:type II secretory pathway component PulL